jgi:hypothetical protein
MRLPDYNPTIVGMIRAIAEKYGDAEAVVRDGDRVTFRQLEARSAAVAKALLAAGAGKGSRIALLLPPRPEYVVYLFAIGRIGAIALPLSTLYQAPELQWVLENSEADYLITADSFMNHDYLTRIEEALPGLAGALPPFRLHAAPRLRKIWVLGDSSRSWSRTCFSWRRRNSPIRRTTFVRDCFCCSPSSSDLAQKGLFFSFLWKAELYVRSDFQTKLPPLVAAHGVGTLGTILKDVLLGVFTLDCHRRSLFRICLRSSNSNNQQPGRSGGG